MRISLHLNWKKNQGNSFSGRLTCHPVPIPGLNQNNEEKTPPYIFTDLNAQHRTLGQNRNNHIGSEMLSVSRKRGKGRPNIILSNKNLDMNSAIQPLATLDHISCFLPGNIISHDLANKCLIIKRAGNCSGGTMYEAAHRITQLAKDAQIPKLISDMQLLKIKGVPKKKYTTLPHL